MNNKPLIAHSPNSWDDATILHTPGIPALSLAGQRIATATGYVTGSRLPVPFHAKQPVWTRIGRRRGNLTGIRNFVPSLLNEMRMMMPPNSAFLHRYHL